MTALMIALKTIAVLTCSLILAAIVGTVSSGLLEILVPRFFSALLPYAIWLVLGIYCGLLSFGGAGAWASGDVSPWTSSDEAPHRGADWTSRPDARGIGTGIVIVAMIEIIPLAALAHLGSTSWHSLVFFGSVTAGLCLGRWALMPNDVTPRSGRTLG